MTQKEWMWLAAKRSSFMRWKTPKGWQGFHFWARNDNSRDVKPLNTLSVSNGWSIWTASLCRNDSFWAAFVALRIASIEQSSSIPKSLYSRDSIARKDSRRGFNCSCRCGLVRILKFSAIFKQQSRDLDVSESRIRIPQHRKVCIGPFLCLSCRYPYRPFGSALR